MTTNPCNTRGPIMADMFFRSYQQLTFMNWQACHMLRCFCWSLPNSTLETGSCSLGTIAPWYCRKIEQIMPSPFGLPERSLIWHPLRRPRVRVSSPVSGEISKACLAFGCPAPSPPATRSPPRGCAPCCGPRRSVAEPSSHGGSVPSFCGTCGSASGCSAGCAGLDDLAQELPRRGLAVLLHRGPELGVVVLEKRLIRRPREEPALHFVRRIEATEKYFLGVGPALQSDFHTSHLVAVA